MLPNSPHQQLEIFQPDGSPWFRVLPGETNHVHYVEWFLPGGSLGWRERYEHYGRTTTEYFRSHEPPQ